MYWNADNLLLCIGMLTICCYYWNVGNLLLCTGMLTICCYVLECWQFVVMYWNVVNLLLYTGMLVIFCYVLESWRFHDKQTNIKKFTLLISFYNALYKLSIWRNLRSWSSSNQRALLFQVHPVSDS